MAAAAAAGKVAAHVQSQGRPLWIGKGVPGFVSSLFRSAPSYRQAPSASAELVFCTVLLGHLQNPEKWILTLAGFTEIPRREHAREPALAAGSPGRREGGPWVPRPAGRRLRGRRGGGPGRVEGLGRGPGVGLGVKPGAQVRRSVLGTEGDVVPRVWPGAFCLF